MAKRQPFSPEAAAPQAAGTVSDADQDVAALRRELADTKKQLAEALQQQTATAEVLHAISQSTSDLQPVLESVLESAIRLCGATRGHIYRVDGNILRFAAASGAWPGFAEYLAGHPLPIDEGSAAGRAAARREIVQINDVLSDVKYTQRELVKQQDFRTVLAVPMFRDHVLLGVIAILKSKVEAFTPKQIDLVKTFADQAVIAIENTRLLNELRQRSGDLSEALERQTATSEILKVISSSAGDLDAVFNAILESATQVCGANFGVLYRFENGKFHPTSLVNAPADYAEFVSRRGPFVPRSGNALDRVSRTKQTVVSTDEATEPVPTASARLAGARTQFIVPMLKADELIGVIAIYRQDVRPFTGKQIELVENFAAQAVIAIENTRLLGELRESLQRQTATADVLKVISRSTFDLRTVLDTLTASAAQLCDADMAAITQQRADGQGFSHVTNYNFPPDWIDYNANIWMTPDRGSVVGRVLLDGKAVQVADVLADPEYTYLEPARKAGYRTFLGVPLMRQGQPIGVVTLARKTVAPFTDKQIELVSTFADQAVIAIENTRLFREVEARTEDLAESLQQQTATADVLKVISRSAFDLRTVLDTLIESATRMCDADQGAITREIGGEFFRAASYGYSPELLEFIRKTPVLKDRSSIAGRAMVEGRIVQIADITTDPEYTFSPGLESGDFRSALGVPMLKEGVTIGVLALTRRLVRPFTDQQIELVATFADQAAIAIENARLFDSVQTRTRELAASLEDLRAAQDRLIQSEKLASLGQLTAGIAHEIKNPLNFVNNFSAISIELIDELRELLDHRQASDAQRAEMRELMGMLQGNLDKIVQHGKRADSIVKNMLLHARHGSGEHRSVDINAMVEDSLNLAYHGARAEKPDFNIVIERSLDPRAGEVDLFPQEITRVLLNLISNGFYAATKRQVQNAKGGYDPVLSASTRNLGDRVEIRIRDNGTGIPPEVKDRIFDPFFTTKPAGEGTGLGLSLSHDIVVKQHAGSLEVETELGEFTEFRIVLPRAGATVAKTTVGD